MFLAFVISLAFAIGIWLLFDRDGSRKSFGRLYAKYASWMEARPERYSARKVARWREMALYASEPNALRHRVSRAAGSAAVTIAIVLTIAYMTGGIEA
jgi:hypothetical protein